MFVGDSTSRRAARQLQVALDSKHLPFLDEATHASLNFSVNSSLSGGSTLILSHWLPRVRDLLGSLRGTPSDFTVDEPFGDAWVPSRSRKIIVLHYGTWNVHGWLDSFHLNRTMRTKTPKLLGNFSLAVAELKRARGVDMTRDIILFRTPVARDCVGEHRQSCDPSTHSDPANFMLGAVSRQMAETIQRDHPDVGVIDAFAWTVAPQGKLGRHPCAPSDEKGIHFKHENGRMAYLSQVIHAAKLMTCGHPAWQTNQQGARQSVQRNKQG
jgi:hypothetical protein